MLEIGPGIGVLTKELAARAGKVVVVELDQRLLPVLEETLRGAEHVKVIHGDIMKLDLAALLRERFENAEILIAKTAGLCSFYAEAGGLLVGFEE